MMIGIKKEIGVKHFCCTYIRNDMLGTAAIPHFCYGFNDMAEGALIASSPSIGLRSNMNSQFVSTFEGEEEYLMPDAQISNSDGINEIDYRRIQNGKRKQPDYIVLFKIDGKIDENQKREAKNAAQDFGGLAIVVIDVDKCLKEEKRKLQEMQDEYASNPTAELGEKIITKIRTNHITAKQKTGLNSPYRKYFSELFLETRHLYEKAAELPKNEKKVTLLDLEKNDTMVTDNERNNTARRIYQLIIKLTDKEKASGVDKE